MRTTILIPTDFTSVPLLLLKQAAMNSDHELDVVFMYSTSLTDSITDLLFYSPKKILDKAINKEFSEGCSIMMNKYPNKIRSIRYELFHAATTESFNMLVKVNKVDEVWLPQDYSFAQHGSSFDPTAYIMKSKVPVHEVAVQVSTRVVEHDLIAQLLTS